MTREELKPGATAAESAGSTRRERRRQDSEARILAAAEQVFAEAGFSGASTALIAARARLPKANVHYYFGTKERLYRAVLERILEAWLASGEGIRPEADPAAAFAGYIAAKIEASRRRPYASKVFANELLHGAPQLADYLGDEVRRWVEEKSRVIEGWVAEGRIRPVAAPHLFFAIWAATQTYADFECQIRAVLGRRQLRPDDYADATAVVTRMVLGACGLPIPAGKGTQRPRSRPGGAGSAKAVPTGMSR
jgi:TetR/AcrR family transcriptional regulator